MTEKSSSQTRTEIVHLIHSTLEKPWLNLQFHDTDQKIIKKPNEFKIKKEHYPSLSNQDNILNKVKGSLFGLALGDALGAHVEFRPHIYLATNPVKDLIGGGTWGLEKGQVGKCKKFL